MTVAQALVSFLLAATLLTITPGLDTALVLRTATVEGPGRALRAAAGIVIGCLLWGAGVALGLGALLSMSGIAFTLLRGIGAAYLLWLGLGLLFKQRAPDRGEPADARVVGTGFVKGLLQNLLNPKVGVFYVSFLPQFVPADVPAPGFILLLASVHALLGVAWFAALISATRPVARLLRRPAVTRTVDRLTGCVFIGFGAKLALTPR